MLYSQPHLQVKESCHSKVRISASISQALLVVLGTYTAEVTFELLMQLRVTAHDSSRKQHGEQKC